MIAKTAIIFENVELGENVRIEDYCIIGGPFAGSTNEKTIIGDNSIIRAQTIIYAGNTIGHNFQSGNKANIRELNTIGDNVSIGTSSVIEHHVHISRDVRIHSQVFIPEYSFLEKGSWIGPNVVFTNAKYPKSKDAKKYLLGPRIGVNAKIGANSTLLPGVTIGRNSLIGAGSLVNKSIPDNVLALGSPVRIVRSIDY